MAVGQCNAQDRGEVEEHSEPQRQCGPGEQALRPAGACSGCMLNLCCLWLWLGLCDSWCQGVEKPAIPRCFLSFKQPFHLIYSFITHCIPMNNKSTSRNVSTFVHFYPLHNPHRGFSACLQHLALAQLFIECRINIS